MILRLLPFHFFVLTASMVTFVLGYSPALAVAQDKKPDDVQRPPIPIAEIKRIAPVDFEKEILPILKNNCLACHNQTITKGDLVLETPQTILKGGESGPAVLAGQGAESLLLQAASHQKKPKMPPKDNKVAAYDLKTEELGLLKLWVDQGAKGEVHGAGPIVWHPLPEGLNPIYAVALTADEQFAACGRANQIFIYHLPSGQLVTRLTDPQLAQTTNDFRPGLAHRDMVHALAFSPEGNLLASGAYREVKLWRRPRNPQKFHWEFAATNSARTVASSSDGKWLATGGADGSIQMWDLASGKSTRTLAGHEKAVTSLKFSPDNLRLCSGSTDGVIRVWTISDGTLMAQAGSTAPVNAVTWVAEGKQLASGGDDALIRIWQLPDPGKDALIPLQELKGHEGPVTSLDTIVPSGKEIISGGADGSLRHWNLEKGVIRQMDHGGPVTAVAVRSDGKRFASAGLNHAAKLWNAEDGKPIAELKGDRYAQELVATIERALDFGKSELDYHKSTVQSAETKLKTENDRLAKVTDANTKAETIFLEKQKAFLAAAETKTAAEKKIADLLAEVKKSTGTFEAAKKASKQATEEAKAAIETAAQAKLAAEQAEQNRLDIEKLAADAAGVASKTKGASDKPANDTSEFVQKTKAFAESVAAEAAAKAKAAADARVAAEKAIDDVGVKAFAAGQIKVRYDQIIAESPEKQRQATNKLEVAAKTFTDAEKEFKKVEITKINADHEVQLANNAVKQSTTALSNAKAALKSAETAQQKTENELAAAKKAAAASEQPLRTLAFSPDRLTLATAGDDQAIHTWSANTGVPFDTLNGHTGAVYAVAFTGARSLASASADQSAVVWDFNAGWTLERVIGTGDAPGAHSGLSDRVNSVRFSPDGQLLATGGGEPTRSGEIKLWHIADGRLAQEFTNVHSDAVFALDFSPDGKYLASGAADKFTKVSEVNSGKVFKSFEGHTHHVLGVSWKRDGRTLASAGADNAIKIWDFLTGERKKAAGSGTDYRTAGFNKEVTSISYIGATDQALITSGDNQVRIIRDTGESQRAFAGAADYMYSAAVTPDGKLVIAGGQDGVLRIWNGTNGVPIAEYLPPKAM